MMRIAVFSDSVLPAINGVSISVASLVGGLRDAGHSVRVFAPRYGFQVDEDPYMYRFPSFRLPGTKDVNIAYPPYLPLLRRFRRYEFDVVHTHTCGTLGFVGLRWAQSHELPIVSTYHTLYDRYAHYFKVLPRRYIRFKIAKHTNYYYNRVDQVITPSDASRRWLQRHAVTTPITVIPTGTRAASLIDRSEARARLGIAPQLKICLFVGRLAEEKNMDTLLHAFALAAAQEPELRLWIVGDGPYREDCVRLTRRLHLGDKVKYAGFVPPADVDLYYSAADFFFFASITETQGLVVNEAMCHGLPCVLVDGGGAGSFVESGVNGILTLNTAASLAENLIQVVRDNELCAKLGANARKSVRETGTDEMVKRVVRVYEAAIGREGVSTADRVLVGL